MKDRRPRRSRVGEARVPIPGETESSLVDRERRARSGNPPNKFKRVVFGTIVPDDEIKIAVFLREDASKRFAQVPRAVEGRDRDGDSRKIGHESTLRDGHERELIAAVFPAPLDVDRIHSSMKPHGVIINFPVSPRQGVSRCSTRDFVSRHSP